MIDPNLISMTGGGRQAAAAKTKRQQEEARAGWELVEKFDDNRVRLRRPMAARGNDHLLDGDPYRTWIGVSDAGLVVRVLLGSALVGAAVLLIFLLVRG